MKIKNLLKYESETGKSFFDLSKKFESGEFSMHDIRDMVYIVKLETTPDLKIQDAINDDESMEDLLSLVGKGMESLGSADKETK